MSDNGSESTNNKRVLCFGDSLTWGWDRNRHRSRVRDTQRRCGGPASWLRISADGYTVVEEGLSARTTTADDPTDARLNGSSYLPAALATHLPLDLAIVMLGTNDTKSNLGRSAFETVLDMSTLAGQVLASAGGVGTLYPAPQLLIVSPPPLAPIEDPWFEMTFAGGHEKSTKLAAIYRSLASFLGVEFLDAGSVITTDGVDGVHFTQDNNADLGTALAERVHTILAD